jgi:4-amino-4-deoxy-L-arabinose transferase-like glycosyltransferase
VRLGRFLQTLASRAALVAVVLGTGAAALPAAAGATGDPAATRTRQAAPAGPARPAPGDAGRMTDVALAAGLLAAALAWVQLVFRLRARARRRVAEPVVGDGVVALRPGPRFLPPAAPRLVPPPAPVRALPRSPPRLDARTRRVLLGLILLAAAGLRLWQLDAVGLNSDETVYAGQGAAIAGNPELAPYFPTFRAHPLLFQSVVSIGFLLNSHEVFGRVAAALMGVATVYFTYALGRLLYGARAGLVAGAILALMPYHVIVTRQILLDGPRTLMSTITLYVLARYAITERVTWLNATAAALGLTFLCKEDSVILVGAIYAFLALTPGLRTDIRDIIGATAIFALIFAALTVALDWAGKTGTGGDYLVWQLFRRPNHSMLFYPEMVPVAIGLGVVACAAAGLWLLRRDSSWRETLLCSWIAVPVVFFELFPVKGFQYLLPIAPAVAVLAGRFIAHWDPRTLPAALGVLRTRAAMAVVLGILLVSLAIPAWQRVQPSQASTLLAGQGGMPGGREAGRWIAQNVPKGAQMLSIGPSMANVLQFYGHRKVYGLSVSANPLHRNPVYEPVHNPDRRIRENELQYIAWDAFSADRSPFFAQRLMRFVERYDGHVVHTETITVRSPAGDPVHKPVIVIYEVSP